MIESKFLNKEELKEFYNKLRVNILVGYIQLSDSRITEDKLFLSPKILPEWNNDTYKYNFIYEAAFFDEKSNISTLIRQIDDKWLVNTVNLKELEQKDDYKVEEPQTFIAKKGRKVKMINIWQEQKDELCENFPVLKHVYSAFAGFEGGEND
jgi:CRISPR type III-associated protein (TIGR04423 family)